MEQESRTDDMGRKILENEIEAYLFASDAPLSAGRLSSITGISSIKEIKEAVNALEEFYRSSERSFGIVEVAGGYQLVTLPEFSAKVVKLFKGRRKARLSRPALETLAIIAYKQPISRLDVEAIRGVNCDGVLSTLIDRELVAITGKGEGVGKPYLYSTTTRFLEYLGLKDYRELPDMQQLEKNLENLELIPRPVIGDEAGVEEDSAEDDYGDEDGTGEEDGDEIEELAEAYETDGEETVIPSDEEDGETTNRE